MSRENMQALLKEFGSRIGIEGLSLDRNGFCCLFFDDIAVNVEVPADSDQVFFYVNLGEIPRANAAELFEKLLEANHLYRKTAGGTIGIDKAADVISLAYQCPIQVLDIGRLEKILENFVNTAEFWLKELRAFQFGESTADAPTATAPAPMGIRA